jgi:hypothetical protein
MAEHYRAEYVKCGKKGCKSCPHGPYWYGYERLKGKLHKRYYGKLDPRDKAREREKRETHPWNDVFLKSKVNLALCRMILGMPPQAELKDAKKRFRVLTMELHPDRGGDEAAYKRVVVAWSYIKSFLGE